MKAGAAVVDGEYIRISEAARIMGFARQTTWRHTIKYTLSKGGKRCRLRAVKIGGILKTTRAWVAEFIAELNDDGAGSAEGGRATTSPTGPVTDERDDVLDREARKVRARLVKK